MALFNLIPVYIIARTWSWNSLLYWSTDIVNEDFSNKKFSRNTKQNMSPSGEFNNEKLNIYK